MKDYDVKGEWQETDQGRVYVARAIAKPSGRILGIAKIEVPIMTGFDISQVYGKEVTEAVIIQVAEEMAHRFGRAAK